MSFMLFYGITSKINPLDYIYLHTLLTHSHHTTAREKQKDNKRIIVCTYCKLSTITKKRA